MARKVKLLAREMIPIDITNAPNLRRVADDVATSRTPRVLRRGGEDVAVVLPISPKRAPRRGQPTSADDPLWQIIGMADTAAPDAPTDVSSHKYKYLADAYDTHRL